MVGRRRRLWPPLAGAACLAGVAAAHATEVAPMLDRAAYVGVLFALLIAASVGLALLLLLPGGGSALAWPLAAVLALSAMAAYVASRTVGLPELGDYVGHWIDLAAGVALICEAVLVLLAATETARPRRGTRTAWSTRRRAAPAVAGALLVFAAGAAAQEAVDTGEGAAARGHGAAGSDR